MKKKTMANSGMDGTQEIRQPAPAGPDYAPTYEGRERPTKPVRICGNLCNPILALFIVMAVATSFIYSGCRSSSPIHPEGPQGLDLTDNLVPILNPGLHAANLERNMSVIRRGIRRDAVILMAPVTVRTSFKGISGRRMLEGWATPLFNVGDGFQMNLFLIRKGERRLIDGRYFDAGRKFEDRDWIPIAIPLDIGQDDQLEIEVTAGPQGNLDADWLALSSLRLTRGKRTP
jgi:hypothetical protein